MNPNSVQQRCFIGLGSNLQEPLLQVQQACQELANIPNSKLIAVSPWYQTKAIGPEQPDYINGVAELQTSLAPLVLLDTLQAIEQLHDRKREVHWGPRTLDLDLLLYGNETINETRLTVPHPYLFERNFVLIPLADIAPELIFNDGSSLQSRLKSCGNNGISPLTKANV